MESKIMSQLGIPGFDPFYLLLASCICILILIILIVICAKQKKRIRVMGERLDALCSGKQGESLEEEIGKILEDNRYLLEETENHKKGLRSLNRRMETTFQKMKLVRYDAYREMGGKLSFVLVVLDEFDNGYLINSVHNSTGCFCYAKEIVRGECEITLSEEEIEVLEETKAIRIQH